MKFKIHKTFRHTLSVITLWMFSVSFAFGGIVISGGGLVLIEEGGTIQAENLATGGTAFAENVGGPPHTVAKVNNGVFGNSDSWIGGTTASFVGINLGATPVPLGQVAFGRDNLGSFTDRTLGTYTLQYTTVANPDEMTAEANWTTIGTLDYQSAGGTNFGNPAIRHLFTFTEVMATGFRIKTVAAAVINDWLGIDELELYSPDLVISGGGLTLIEEGGSIQAGNLATGGTAFAQDGLGGTHAIAKVNDGVFGNPDSWVSVLASSFIGIDLGATPVLLGQVSFGRDNLGAFTDRTFGTYTLQYTTVPNPDETTAEGNWSTVGTLDYHSAGGINFANPSTRHTFSFAEIMATGFRIKTMADALPIGIDELELYPPATGITIEHPASTPLVAGTSKILFGSQSIGVPSAAKIFTIRNSGTVPFAINSVSTTGGEALDFIVDTGGMGTTVPALTGSTTFSVIFNPSSSGTRTTTLRVSSNTTTPDFDITLTGNDFIPPVIESHADVTAAATSGSGATVTYDSATATDNSGDVPSLSYSAASGSLFPLGVTTVTITATDGSGNMSTSTFTVTVSFPPPLLVQEGGTFGSGNLATGGTAFAQDVLGGITGNIPKLNDGIYGNANGWIAGSGNSFLGINLGATPVAIKRVAFGRDNLDQFSDRWQGTYTLQYTSVANPDAATPEGNWISLGVLDYDTMSGPLFTKPWLRHVFSFPEVLATGFRIKVATTALEISIDEIELYNTEPVIGIEEPVGIPLVTGSASVDFGTQDAGVPGAAKVFTVKNTGPAELLIHSVSTVDSEAADFIVDTSSTVNAVPFATGTTTFSVTFSPTAHGSRTTTLRVSSNDSMSPDFDITLTGTGNDTTPPMVIHPDVEIFTPGGAGTNVTFTSATATDNSGVPPSLSYSPASGSIFSLGETIVTVTATDGSGNMAMSTFTVTVGVAPELIQQGGAVLSGNLATGGTAFAQDVLSGITGNIPKLNDGIYGNANGWIAGSANSFLGINLGATPVVIKRVAFGRDNLDQFFDRWQGTYTLQYTSVANPDAATPEGSWISLGVLDYDSMSGPLLTKKWLRHEFVFPEVLATGFRIKVATTALEISIDEIELYNTEPNIGIEQPVGTALLSGSASIAFGDQEAGVTSAAKIFTIENTGAGELFISGVSTVTGEASDFMIDLSSTTTILPTLTGITTFGVTFDPSGLGSRTTTLRVSSNDGTTPDFNITLTGTGIDTTPPVIVPHPDVAASIASGTGANVTYAPATATDSSGVAPSLSYSPVSGSLFPLGDTTVTITATDSAGLMSMSTFTVTVGLAPQLIQEGGTILPSNLATGGTAFANDVLNGIFSNIPKLNDGIYGNSNGWIAGSANSFLGINLGATPVAIKRVAFGRDNTDQFFDRWQGTYHLQYTAVANPNASTPDGSWITVGVLDYDTLSDPLFAKQWLRHVFSFPEVLATGFRIKVAATTIFEIGIDEIELYGTEPTISIEHPVSTVLVPGSASISFGTLEAGIPSTPKTFTIKNTGAGELGFSSVSAVGDEASDFIVDTSGMSTTVSPLTGTTTFSVTFNPTGAGVRTTTLRVSSNDGTTPNFDITLLGTGIDITPPVIDPHADVIAFAPTAAGVNVSYAPATAMDSSGIAPTLSYSPISGSLFPVGQTTVTITATDGSGNVAMATFTVTVSLPPQIVIEQPVATVLPLSRTPVGWGNNASGQTTVPGGLTKVRAVSAGKFHSLALKNDHTVAAWGDNGSGQTAVPGGLVEVQAIAAGGAHSLTLRSDQTVVAWGRNFEGQTSVPDGLTNVTAIAAGEFHSLALRNDGTVIGWGSNSDGQTTIPSGLGGVTAIAAGSSHSLALKSDGTVIGWGSNSSGQTTIPSGLGSVTAIAVGNSHNLALKSDGTVVAWGYNSFGLNIIPSGLTNTNVIAIACGQFHSLALRNDGTVIGWGLNNLDQTVAPGAVTNGISIAAGGNHSLAIQSVSPRVDYGTLAPGASIPKTFTLRNTGIGSLDLTNVVASGGQVGEYVVDTGSLPSTIAPGGSGTFTVTFQSSAIGTRATTLRVLSNDPAFPIAELTLTANVSSTPLTSPQLASEGGSFAPQNLAAGKTPFAKDIFSGAHAISNLNDGIYGNSESWIAGSTHSFFGINLGLSPQPINQVAFGRDNTDTFSDRWQGNYTFQFTQVPNPDATTPDSDWITLGTLTHEAAGGANFAKPWLRHVYDFSEVMATGVRIQVVASTVFQIGIDEVEIYGRPLTPLESWRELNLGTTLNTGETADTADFDKDGLANLVEYAFGTIPDVQTPAEDRPKVSNTSSQLAFTYKRPVGGVAGITYGVETSENLGGWQPAVLDTDYTLTLSPNGDGTETVTLTFAGGLTDPKFVRLAISN